ncbi:hypothetical protein ACWDBD_02725 [Streptomyces sp. NPDC001118]
MNALIDAIPSRLRLPQDAALPEGPTVGFDSTTNLSAPLPAPADVAAREQVTSVKSSFFARTFSGASGEQLAACATVLEAPGTTLKMVDAFVLEAHQGDLLDAKELVHASGYQLQERDGWWDALTGCLGRDCGGVCLSAALSCPKVDWASFLICLAGRCGVCVVKCAACATCNCTWWCKWAAGCCDN